MAQKKPFLLRLPPALMDDLSRWAKDDLRSLNAQIEFLLRDALRQAKRTRDLTEPPTDDSSNAA